MSHPLQTFLSRFAPEITIEVHPDVFTFRGEDSHFSSPAVVWLADGPKGRRIAGFGESRPSTESVKISLFSGPPPASEDPDFLLELLVGFIQHGLSAVLTRRRFLRPVVTFEGIRTLDHRLGGFQANLLRAAVRMAGAVEVRFDSPPQRPSSP